MRGEAADLFGHLRRLVAGHAVHPQMGRAREGDDAELVLRLKLAGQHAQRLVDDPHAVGAFHRAGVVEQQHEVQRPARLAAQRGGLDREAQQVAVLRKRILRPLPGKGDRHARRRLRVAVIEGVDELLAAHRGRLGHDALLQARRRQLERHVADVEREGGEGIVAVWTSGWGIRGGGGGLGRGQRSCQLRAGRYSRLGTSR